MALREILHFPDSRLRLHARPVEEVDDSIRALVDDMFETMYAGPGSASRRRRSTYRSGSWSPTCPMTRARRTA
jgi:hypothetical protein